MAISMVKDYLSMMAVKSPAWFKGEKDGEVKWHHDLVPLREGIVDWKQVLGLLKSINFDGPISLHSEYENIPLEETIRLTRDDLAYMKSLAARI
jgi:sugar phosphate isomerase/epimerase